MILMFKNKEVKGCTDPHTKLALAYLDGFHLSMHAVEPDRPCIREGVLLVHRQRSKKKLQHEKSLSSCFPFFALCFFI